jgi:hypothetical protein
MKGGETSGDKSARGRLKMHQNVSRKTEEKISLGE